MTHPGFFLVLEGPEGAGKSTLVQALADQLRAMGVEPVLVREPGGTPAAEALRRELLNADRQWTPELELLYVVAARADVVEVVTRPALEAGRLVLGDRYALSTRAYQGAGRGVDLELLERLNRLATRGLEPDLTVILDLDPRVGAERLERSGRTKDRLDRESTDFHDRVAARYLAEHGPTIRHLDATLPVVALVRLVLDALRDVRPGLIPGAA